MKVAILTDSFPPRSEGGAAVIAKNHAQALIKAGHEVLVITTTDDPYKEGKGTENGYSIAVIYSKYALRLRAYKSLNNRRVVREVDKLLAGFKPDIVHAHNLHLHLSYASLKAAKKHAKAVFLTAHDSMSFHYSKLFPETVGAIDGNVKSYKVSAWKQLRLFKWGYNPFRNSIIKKYLKIPTKIFAVSNALARALTDNGIQNVEVLHNGIDVTEWEMKPQELRSDKNFIFFGGRLSAVKGGGVLVAALKEVLKKRQNTRLMVVGEKNDFAREMELEAQTIGFENLIFFTGKVKHEDMKTIYPSVAMVAVPSLCFDWFPTVVLEAMACKRPVIASCFGGAKEMVEHGKTGYIVNPLHLEDLTKAIFDILNNLHADEMGQAGYERVKAEFSMDKHMEKLLAWYDKALK